MLEVFTGKNISIENCYNYGEIINQVRDCAGIVSKISETESAQISGCINYGNIANSHGYTAGIVQRAYGDIKIYNCINYGNIGIGSSAGGNAIAGICADAYSKVQIQKCINYGNIESKSTYVGGISAYSGKIVKECGNYGTLKGTGYVGGIIGTNYANIENTFNRGDIYVSGNYKRYASGIAAFDSSATTVKNSYTTRKNICWTF